MKSMKVLGIETSCDETGVAVYETGRGLLAHSLYSQSAMHAEYGGVVPELASRDHIQKLTPLIRATLQQAGLRAQDLDGVAYTRGPGLVGALLVGSALGRALALALGIPALGVHHMEGHLLAPMLDEGAPDFPFVALLVSGGHTQLMSVKAVGDYEMLGRSVDDAAGEAFDKTASVLGLGYPGGPAIAEAADSGDPDHFSGRFAFPRPMTDRPGLDFSFSGLKTFVINTWAARRDEPAAKENIAAAFQQAVVDVMLVKCRRAIERTGFKTLVVAGGVGANRRLRQCLVDELGAEGVRVCFPALRFCTDNGAMIALAGALRLAAGQHDGLNFSARARWPMQALPGL